MFFARRLLDLMLLRAGPQDMPGNQNTLIASAAAYCILLFVQVALIAPLSAALVQAVLATVLLAVYVSVVLRLRKLPNRFHQTATALFCAGAVLTLLMLGPTHAMGPYLDALAKAGSPRSVPAPAGFIALSYVVLGLWGLAVYSNVYRHALDATIPLGVAAAIGFELLLIAVFSVLG